MYKCDQYPDLVLVKNSASGVLELVAQPVETLVEAVTRGGTGGLDRKKVKTKVFDETQSHLNVPVSVSQAVKAQLVRDLCGVHCIWQILLVGEDQQNLKTKNMIVDLRTGEFKCSPPPSVRPLQAFSSARLLPHLLSPWAGKLCQICN